MAVVQNPNELGYRKTIEDEIRRKAMLGDPLATKDPNNQKIYDQFRKQIDDEIKRKALKGEALTNPNAYNQAMYDKFIADNKTNNITNTNTDNNQVGDVGKSDNTQTNTGTTTQTATQTPQNYIEGLTKAKRDAQIASLSQSRDQALSNLQGEKEGIAPKYYDARNQLAAGAQQQARNFAEYMAARGGTTSGANAQATLMNNMSLQGNLGALGRQEAQDFGDIARRESDVRNQYLNNLNQAEAGILSDRMNLLLNDYYRAQERGDRLTQQAIQNEFARAGLTGFLDGQRTLAGQGFDRNVFESDRAYDRGVLESDRSNDNWNRQFMADITGTYVDADGVVRQTTAEQQRQLSQLWALADQTGVIGAQLGEIYGLPANTPTMAGKQFALNEKQTNANIANANSRLALDQQQTNQSIANAQTAQNQDNINTLLNIWEMSGVAPKGLEAYGVPEGTAYNKQTSSSSSSGATSTVDARTSNTNKVEMKNNFDNEKWQKEQLAKAQAVDPNFTILDVALATLEQYQDQLSDKDYNELYEYIYEEFGGS